MRSQLQVPLSPGQAAAKHTSSVFFTEDILLELAEKHSQHSSTRLTKIAREMNFPSIYVFSRFYKRKTGA
ncbi:MAG: hypothetical protein V8T87_13170 [Victivallales bacterium]